jgi:23S rRNA pseudouridine1911/1915/1917 synthase
MTKQPFPRRLARGLLLLYEDRDILAVDKPAGVLVHPSRAQYRGTLLSRALGYLRETGQPLCAHPVHRLDRGTSGIVLFAKHPHIQARWMRALQAGAVQKTYEALALGAFPALEGRIDAPIARASAAGQRREARRDGQPALTDYRALETLSVRGRVVTRVAFFPATGRTHQLRVHSLWAGCPLLGDALYCTPESLALSQALGLDAQLLRAVALAFPHPLTGEPVRIRCAVR